ncbi:MAG TPA: GNAT family N-acetyltransferase [Flavobacteriales bacterium]|nr:GNAT family N-acetyltransferase [Flavobacteriales bacterium]
MSAPSIEWHVKPFAALTGREVHDIMRLRVDVFVVEQRCVYPEIDGQDPEAVHVLGIAGNGTLAAYARILPPHGKEPPHIGRVIVHPAFRGNHLGRHLMHQALNALHELYGSRRSALAAQAYLVDFYGYFGYIPVSEAYPWDGMPHVDMTRDAP